MICNACKDYWLQLVTGVTNLVEAAEPTAFAAFALVGDGGRAGEAAGAKQIAHELFFRRGRRRDVLVERARVGFGDVGVGERLHEDLLPASAGTRDLEPVARLQLAMRLRRALAVHLDLPALAGALRFGAGLEQARDVEPDVETGPHVFNYAPGVLATILRKLGLEVDVDDDQSQSGVEALDALEEALSHVPPDEARRVAAFAYLLSRVAHANHEVTDAEREAMVHLLVDRAQLAPDRAAIVIGLATSKIVHVRGTQDYLVSREVASRATIEEKRALVDGLYAVCAADGLISTVEDNDVRRVASGIDLEHRDVVDIRSRYRDSLAVLKD